MIGARGNIALIDGMGALLLIALLYATLLTIGNEIDTSLERAHEAVEVESLRCRTYDALGTLNLSGQPLEDGSFSAFGLWFTTTPPETTIYQTFFLTDDLGWQVLFIAKKD